jgi:two-component system sensor histidine kinase/response regulator
MTIQWVAGLAGILLIVMLTMLTAAYVKVRRQNSLIRLQSREIERKIRELVAQNAASEQLLREKKALVLLLSHDLKGPFNRVYALMQLLEMSEGGFTDEQKEYLGKMYQVVGDGLNMVRNLVDVRRIEERGVDPHPERIDLAHLVASIVNQYRIAAEKKSIALHLQSPDRMEFTTDKGLVARIVENLLSNAVKFSQPNKNVHVTLSRENEIAKIVVRDEGPGISAEDQQKLYQRFQKLSARPTGGETSTGVGLSIVNLLVTGMGGDIKCESTLDHGATFSVRLPGMVKAATATAASKVN